MSTAIADPLLDPFELGPLQLRNRLVSTSHEPSFGEEGMPKDRYRLYHVEKAKGGIGLTMIGGSAVVSRDSPPAFGNLLLYRDEIVPWLRRLSDDVHEHGAAVMCQVTHLGRRTSNYTADWLPLLYPSAMREPTHRAYPKVAEDWDIDRVVRDYADAAARCKAAGLDGIEIESYGHFMDAFLSPATNERTDEWGGSLANRMRFPLRVLGEVRAAVGPDFVVGIRMMMDEVRPGGLTYTEALAALKTYCSEVGLDFVSVIKGSIESDAANAAVITSMGTPSAPFLEFCGRVKRDVAIPVMHSGRIQDVSTARHAIREGLVDLIGMTRPHIADPHIVAKVEAGAEDRIRPCVGASYCLDAIYESDDSKCIHNASTGREASLPHQIPATSGPVRKAVVIGAGPAGLEAARVLTERGHRVVILEASDQPGGQVRIASSSPRRRDLIGIIDWRVAELKHGGADIRCGVFAERDDVLAEEPEVVIVATGGMPNRAFLSAGADLVSDSWDVLDGSARPSGDVLVYDNHGGQPAMDAAETLANRGAKLHIVTPERTLAPDVGSINSPAYLRAFAENDSQITLGWQLAAVERVGDRLSAELYSEYAQTTRRLTIDHVVVENGTLPNDDLYFALRAESSNLGELDHHAYLDRQPQQLPRNPSGRFQLYRIGDAVASRNIHAAVLEAMRLCVAI